MDLYVKFGDLVVVKMVFNGILDRDFIVYNCLIFGYFKCGDVLVV